MENVSPTRMNLLARCSCHPEVYTSPGGLKGDHIILQPVGQAGHLRMT